ncbi:nuclear transport factor 2 family protein (plasmid) [Tistrella mobilis]|jgi:ketosteroid isomerase-like protein|uniref:nuclear transport factor 2 family protein n=1 Tax=Tistrella mobilis TaxID=171437 RepID=UPI0035586367
MTATADISADTAAATATRAATLDTGALLARFAAAVEANDAAALAACFTADGIYDDYFFGPEQGPEGIAHILAGFYKGGCDFRWRFHDVLAGPGRAYARYRFSYRSTAPEAAGTRVCFDGIACLDLSPDGLIRRYSEVFDRGMALAQQNFAPERIARIGRRYAEALKARGEWVGHV